MTKTRIRLPRPRAAAGATALALLLTGAALVLDDSPSPAARSVAPQAGAPFERLAGADLDRGVSALQTHLRAQPKDAAGWAALGAAYVEQARSGADPTRYPQAEKALARSLELSPGNEVALAGQAALAAARHDFSGALRAADRALRVNAYSERALSSRVDALVELGRYDDALRAARTADARRPGIPVFTRYAYVLELRGDPAGAKRVLSLALDTATAPGDRAYTATQLGQLAWTQGRYDEARRYFVSALDADPTSLAALEGQARTRAAQGDVRGAVRDLEQLVRRSPLPGALAALGELYEASGRRAEARAQYDLVAVQAQLARANGVAVDLDTAVVASDHGDPDEALRAARAEWARRHTVHTADALAWALHRSGRSEEALRYADFAVSVGLRGAELRYHRGMILLALGDTTAGRADVRTALRLNPHFSPLGARAAKEALR
ncbi:tetratricopeptide repeat protein [Streptomyces sp. NPDC051940]|uniref:tetratricopeptide repeat protein n=1 Tax=Streptomyces sp. NPDC051940 TaxID=3155675 RepID=UPI003447E1D7